MGPPHSPTDALHGSIALLGGDRRGADERIRQAAWIARCVGRGESAPLTVHDVTAVAGSLHTRQLPPGGLLFDAGQQPAGVWIVRAGQIELRVGSRRRAAVVGILRPGDVDADIALLLDRPLPYAAAAVEQATCLYLPRTDFERLLATRPPITRRWLSSVAQRLMAAQTRVIGLLGKTLRQQTAQLLLDEAIDGQIRLPQRTLAAMLGAARPSLNKTLKTLQDPGCITISYASIAIVDHDALTRIAAATGR